MGSAERTRKDTSAGLPHWERIQKVLFSVRKKRVQFSSERSLHASNSLGNVGRQDSPISPIRFACFSSDLLGSLAHPNQGHPLL